MPRQLPWKVGSAPTKPTSSRPRASASRSPAPSQLTRRTASTPGTDRKPRRSLVLTPARSPSTSPPPEPLKEEFMIEGIDHDDRYRMVEDEFLAVAGEFTRHLHAAEYQRLRGLARSQNAETIRSISRPVTGDMTDLVRRSHAALDTASRQRRGVAKALERSENEEEARRKPAGSLQELMDSPRKPIASLVRPGSGYRGAEGSPSRRRTSGCEVKGMLRHHSGMDTRANGGGASPVTVKRESTPDSDDDDLDGHPPWPLISESRRMEKLAKPQVRQLSAPQTPARVKAEPTETTNPFTKTGNEQRRTLAHNTPANEANDEPDAANNDDDEDDFFARLRARRAGQKRRRETKPQENATIKTGSQAAALNSIPFI
ncbi:hypothetical protein VTI74DRAFT_8109 [Chaetomium olivicolor]